MRGTKSKKSETLLLAGISREFFPKSRVDISVLDCFFIFDVQWVLALGDWRTEKLNCRLCGKRVENLLDLSNKLIVFVMKFDGLIVPPSMTNPLSRT